MCTFSKMSSASTPIFHFWNFCHYEIYIKTIKNYLSKKTHGINWCRQFCFFFSRCRDLKMCTIIVFIANLLVREFIVQVKPNVIFAKVDRDFVFYFFIFVLLVLFFSAQRVYFFETVETVRTGGDRFLNQFFKIKKSRFSLIVYVIVSRYRQQVISSKTR